jgi:alpha-1,2-mannosyltransferase
MGGAAPSRAAGLGAAARNVSRSLLFVVVPLAVVAGFMAVAIHDRFGFDFRIFWNAAKSVSHGRSPYPNPAAVLHPPPGQPEFFVYPPVLAVVLAPLGVLPYGAAAAVWTAFGVAAVTLALWLLRVNDWRCYTVAFASIPVLSSLRLGSISTLLTLAAAVAWRFRDRWALAGAAVGCAVLAKLFVWPLILWLVFTRRWRATGVATVGAAAVTLAVWAALSFEGLRKYPTLLRDLSHVESVQGFSLVALADRIGLSHPQSSWPLLAVAVAGALVASCFVGCPAADRDRRVFVTAIGLALLLTPILWLHYFTLLLVPVALTRRTFGLEWALFLGFWITPYTQPSHFAIWRLLIALGLTLAIVARAQWCHTETGSTVRTRLSASPG